MEFEMMVDDILHMDGVPKETLRLVSKIRDDVNMLSNGNQSEFVAGVNYGYFKILSYLKQCYGDES